MHFDQNKPYNDLPVLPPASEIESPRVLKKAISASRALAKLSTGKALPNQTVLLNTFFLKEAKESSEIENIVTTDDELYEAMANVEKEITPNTKEVLHYVDALWKGMEWIRSGKPLTTNAFVEIVQTVKQNTAGIRKHSGTKIVNNSTKETIYTPPEGETVIRNLLQNLEEFLHVDNNIDPLVKMAVAHYQFEAIHPFADGNGRSGRIINILYLISCGLLEIPILYLSKYIIEHKVDYYKNLQNVTRNNDWETWIVYMLDAVEQTAAYTEKKMNGIIELMAKTQDVMKSKIPFFSKELLEILFQQPYCKTQFLVKAGIAKEQTARKYLDELVSIGVLDSIKIGREKLYINKPFRALLKE